MASANGWPLGLKWFSMLQIWNKNYVNTCCLSLITIVVWDSRFERRQLKRSLKTQMGKKTIALSQTTWYSSTKEDLS